MASRIKGLMNGCWHLWIGHRHWKSGRCWRCHDKMVDGVKFRV